MAIIDIVKYEQQEGVIVHKFPSCDLRWGSQLVVYPGQVAFFVKGGTVCDKFTDGTYTLKSNNVPLLNKIINLPFGGDSPFQADVWFVNLLQRLSLKWGTETPIQLEDPKYDIIVPVRAHGQYGFKINDAEKFVFSLVGNMPNFNETQLQAYFRGLLLTKLTSIISQKIINDKISVLEIPMHLEEISSFCQDKLTPFYADYGVEIMLFNIISINIPEDDPSLNEIKKAKNLFARLKIAGRDNYKMERSFDVMDKAAENESGAGAAFINAGLGLGASLSMGKQMGNQLMPDGNDVPPPIPTSVSYFLAVNGQQQGPYNVQQIRDAIAQDMNVLNLLAWKKGMKGWQPLKTFVEFATKDSSECPPPIPE
ncbi:SPFH domain-containing protein [Prevotella sp. P6B4]|uniref:SPFH domain-containing protein n=1 Tax=Prevotella sp. P6B4 TaxID=1410614 RepID=UPI0006856341|nr:SPFH domain-containing protein [Prevotella sp. P6B4]